MFFLTTFISPFISFISPFISFISPFISFISPFISFISPFISFISPFISFRSSLISNSSGIALFSWIAVQTWAYSPVFMTLLLVSSNTMLDTRECSGLWLSASFLKPAIASSLPSIRATTCCSFPFIVLRALKPSRPWSMALVMRKYL